MWILALSLAPLHLARVPLIRCRVLAKVDLLLALRAAETHFEVALRQEKQTVEQRFMQQSQELSAARADSEEAAESARVLQVKYDELSAYAPLSRYAAPAG